MMFWNTLVLRALFYKLMRIIQKSEMSLQLLIDYDIDNRLIGKNLLLTIRTILSNNDINIEVFKQFNAIFLKNQ
jgi:hypothetical protein